MNRDPSGSELQRQTGPVTREEVAWPGFPGVRLGWTLADARRPDRAAREAAHTLADFYGRRAVVLRQIHSDRIAWLDHGSDPVTACESRGDGIITDRRDLLIGVSAADCTPLFLLADSWIGVLHAGWRGVVQAILLRALDLLQARIGLGVDQVKLAIGPGIGPCCFEVSPAVAELFPAVVRRPHEKRTAIDLAAAITDQWLRAGGDIDDVLRLDRCTVCSRPELHSHRRAPGPGRNLAYIYHTHLRD